MSSDDRSELDMQRVRSGMRRLRVIASELASVKRHRDSLYAERMKLVHDLHGDVTQHDLAAACECGVDMIKNISANARRRFDGDGS